MSSPSKQQRVTTHSKDKHPHTHAVEPRHHHEPSVPNLDNAKMVATFLMAAGGSYIGLLSASGFEQPFALAVPYLANIAAAWAVPIFPRLSMFILPCATIYAAFFVQHPGVSVAIVSMAGVAAFRVLGMIHHVGLQGNFGTRCCVLSTIPLMQSAVPATESIGSTIARSVATIAACAVAGFSTWKGALAMFGQPFLKDSIFISSAVMGLFAAIALSGLDSMYAILYAFPARIHFGQHIQRAPFLSQSLQEFWNNRWNTSIHHALRHGVYDPMHHTFGWSKRHAAGVAFFASAVLHSLQFVAWRAPRWCWGSVFCFFVVQWLLVELEKKVLYVSSWQVPLARHAWTLAALFLTAPLMTIPLVVVNETWG